MTNIHQIPKPIGTFGGVPLIFSEHMTQTHPRFPDKPNTKRRRRRVIGKYGSWNVTRPAMAETPYGLVVHPALREKLEESVRIKSEHE